MKLVKSMIKTAEAYDDKGKILVGTFRKRGTTRLIEAPSAIRSFNEENGTRIAMLSHETADRILRTFMWKGISDAFPSPVDTAIAYERPGRRIRDEIVLSHREVLASEKEPRVILATTGQAKGLKNVAIMVPSITADDIRKKRNSYIIEVPEERLIIVPDFPKTNGWFEISSDTMLGLSMESSESRDRYLWRREGRYVGLVVRDNYYVDCNHGQMIEAYHCPNNLLGVAVEIRGNG